MRGKKSRIDTRTARKIRGHFVTKTSAKETLAKIKQYGNINNSMDISTLRTIALILNVDDDVQKQVYKKTTNTYIKKYVKIPKIALVKNINTEINKLKKLINLSLYPIKIMVALRCLDIYYSEFRLNSPARQLFN